VEEELNVEEQWKKIEQAIKEASEETIQEQKPARKNWFDEECANIIARKNMARKKMLEKETRANTERYQELRSKQDMQEEEEKKKKRKKKKDKMKRQLEEIEQLSK
jgi:hypothetical protein